MTLLVQKSTFIGSNDIFYWLKNIDLLVQNYKSIGSNDEFYWLTRPIV